VIFALYWPLLLILDFFVTEILSIISFEFVVLQVCAELFVRILAGQSTTPTIDPYVPQAKRSPLYLETFLHLINGRIDRLADDLAPWITVKRRCPTTHTRSGKSRATPRRYFSCWRLIRTEWVSWWRNYLFDEWNYYSWQTRRKFKHDLMTGMGSARRHCCRCPK
jgi:hypothetical protein